MLSASPALVLGAVLLAGATPAPGPAPLLRLTDPRLDESSGLAASTRHPQILWTHNDGGKRAQVMAVDRRGRTVATVTLRGSARFGSGADIDPFDPEALAPGRDGRGRPALFLGDIGDNNAVRRDVSVFRFAEPRRLSDQKVTATWFRFIYPGGPRDAEALLVDPRDGRLWIAAKDIFGAGLYRAPARLRADRVNRLERVGSVPGLVTDGAFLPDGRFVLRTYTLAYVYDRPDHLVAREPLPPQEQGESLAVEGNRMLVGSEGLDSPVYAVRVPGSSTAGAGPPASPSTRRSPSRSAQPGRAGAQIVDGLRDRLVSSPAEVVAVCAALGLLAAVAIARARRRRRRR